MLPSLEWISSMSCFRQAGNDIVLSQTPLEPRQPFWSRFVGPCYRAQDGIGCGCHAEGGCVHSPPSAWKSSVARCLHAIGAGLGQASPKNRAEDLARLFGVAVISVSTRLVAALIVAVVSHGALAQIPGAPTGQQFLGSQVCQGCHAQVWSEFVRNPHFKSVARETEPPERTGCEGCHGPAGLHVINLDKTQIVQFPRLLPSEAQGRCLACHSEDFGKLHIRRSAHLTGEVGCLSCHSVHDAHEDGPLLAARERNVCYRCHQDIRAHFDMPFKHRVNEGAISCTDCHNPHGTAVTTWGGANAQRMVAQALGNDIACVKCHADKRGPFVHEHAPVAVEGCATCHNAHGSTNPRLLNRPAVFALCMECHSDIAGFGTRGEGIPGPTRWFHNLADPTFRECVLCHSKIHGSNVDPLFRR